MGRLIMCFRAEGQFTLAPPQHFLYFFPEPHGHGSFRPTLGALRRSSLVQALGTDLPMRPEIPISCH
jgi:hypothetical protein